MADEKKQAPDKAAEKAAQKEAQARAKQEAAAKAKSQKEEKAKAKLAAKEAAANKGKKEKPPKLSKEEKKALKQQAKEAGAEDAKKEKKYKPKGLFWRIFGICLAFFMGIFSSLGGIAAAIAILLTGPSRDLLHDMLGVQEEDLNQFLTVEYLDKSIFDLFDDVKKDLSLLANPAELTLETFSKYTPLLDTYLNDFIDKNLKDIGITLDLSTIKQLKFSEIGMYAKNDLLPQVELGPLLELDTEVTLEKVKSNAPMYALCYGRIGVDYTVENNAVNMFDGKKPKNITDLVPTLKGDSGETPQVSPTAAGEGEGSANGILDVLGGIELGSFLGLDIRLGSGEEQDNAMLYAMCYGTEDVDFTFEDAEGGKILMMKGDKKATTVTDLIDNADGFINNIELGSLLGLNTAKSLAERANNAMMYTLCYGTEGVDWEVDPETNLIKMLGEKTPTTIGGLTQGSNDVMNELPLGDMLGLNTAKSLADRANNAMMYTLCYGTEGVDWEIDQATGLIKMLGDKTAVTVGDLTEGSNDVVNGLPLGEMLGLNTAKSLADRANNAMMYTLCYGTEGVDWEVDQATGLIKMLDGKTAVTIGDLTGGSNDIVNGLPLGEMLGLNAADKVADRNGDNALMYALCYGTEGEDYTVNEQGLIEMIDGHSATKVGDLSENSNGIIDGLYVDVILSIKPGSDAIMRTVAYGNEAQKKDGSYIMDPDDPQKFATETVVNDAGEKKLQYLGGGRYYIKGEGEEAEIVMLPDPNDPEGKPYAKKTVGDLTAEDADLLEGVTLGSMLDIQDGDSGIMQAMKDWTIDDLKNQDKIEGLKLGQILEIDDSSSKIMQKLQDKSLLELKDQNTIEELKLGDILDIDESSSKIMQKLQDKSLSELKEQSTIEELKLGDILDIDDSSSGIMRALQEKSLSELKEQSTIEDLSIGQILDISVEDDAEKPADVSNLMWALRKTSVGELKDQNTIESLSLSDILEIDDSSSGIMKAMKEWTIGDLNKQSRIERLKIGQIIGIDDSSSGLMKAMKDWRISDLTDQKKIDSLTLGDVITIDMEAPTTPQMLKALHDMTLGEISTSIDTLTLEDVLGSSSFEGENSNKILGALRHYQVKDLGTAISELTVEDVFGDEIWSYAKNYVETERPQSQNIVAKENVETYYYYQDKATVLTGGWYTGTEGSYQPVDPSAKIIQGKDQSYVQQKIALTEKIDYYIFDYDNPSNKAPYAGSPEDIKHDDDFSPYYLDEDGNRVDLGETVSYTLEGGSPAPEGIHVRKEVTEGVTSYYYMANVEVTYLYHGDGNNYYTESDVHVGYRETGTNAEVTAYHAGVWYLLLTDADGADGADGAQTKITGMGTLVSKVAEKINNLTLGEMYVHELIDEDPSHDITLLTQRIPDLQEIKDMKDLTVNQIIVLIKNIAGN